MRIASLALSLFTLTLASPAPSRADEQSVFATSDQCSSCHNGLVTPGGEDVSIGLDWSASVMAHSEKDPYWQAAVRREVMDHPSDSAEIQDECSVCHMPMERHLQNAAGRKGEIFAHLPSIRATGTRADGRVAEGVSCTVCHQIEAEGLGTPESFTGGFSIDTRRPPEERLIFGPFEVDPGRTRVMRSATAFVPKKGVHLQSSELCATCHTLYTRPRGYGDEELALFPEQVPYLEWRHSSFRDTQSCQGCHMPVVESPMAISSVAGQPRENLSRHTFQGGNFFLLRMLNRFRDELGVDTPSHALEASRRRTERFLMEETAALALECRSAGDARDGGGNIEAGARTGARPEARAGAEAGARAGLHADAGAVSLRVAIENLAGHKLPSAYPSRRVWLHVRLTDSQGELLFESGALRPDGYIVGNDNDEDAARFEPHHELIERADQVQIYEPIMGTRDGEVTTGLLTATHYLKDSRLLPRGFDKATAHDDIAVKGRALEDADFTAGGDRVVYRVAVGDAAGPFTAEVSLWFQPIAFRWAMNLKDYDAGEPSWFVRAYEELSEVSAFELTSARARCGRD